MIALFADKLIISTENNSLACRCQPRPHPNRYPRATQTSETTPCVFLRSAGKARYASYLREAAGFIEEGNTAPGGSLPLNTNGGGLSYMHSGMYGMYALQESVRQIRGVAAAQIEGAEISVAHGVGGMFGASGTVVFGAEPKA